MTSSPPPREVKLVILVNRYATPFALLLVVTGLALSQPLDIARPLSIGLLLFSIMFNLAAVRLIQKSGEKSIWLSRTRMVVNLAVNVVLVYTLGAHWPPMWLLLSLTPIATAVYENRAKTILAGLGTSAIIVAIHLIRGLSGAFQWGQTISYAAFIILMSLLINDLARMNFPPTPKVNPR